MTQLVAVLKTTKDNGLLFKCPGCQCFHCIHYGDGDGPRWQWNGDCDKPTFTPSILIRYIKLLVSDDEIAALLKARDTGDQSPLPNVNNVCHSCITDGTIVFLTECTHALAGQTVALPEWTAEDDISLKTALTT